MKKALIVSPYLDHLGGGERYMLTIASVMESLGFAVFFAWDNLEEITTLCTMLGIKLKSPQLDPSIKSLYFSKNPLRMYQATRAYDTVVYLSDGSLPWLGSKKNIVHMQVPFHGVGGRSWQNSLKKKSIHTVMVNSQFTKSVVDAEYGISSTVIYPPVPPLEKGINKEKMILTVGRFEPSLNTKHQEVLIDAFRQLSVIAPDWTFVLAGATASDDWVQELRSRAQGLKITFAVNATYRELIELYQKSTIYWHAAGYGVDEKKNPELTEHFGITCVEAISAGCIPFVVPRGGQGEIVNEKELQWTTIDELVEKTKQCIENQPVYESYWHAIPITQFGLERFKQDLEKIV